MENKEYSDYLSAMRIMKLFPRLKYKRECWKDRYVYYDAVDDCFYFIRLEKSHGLLSLSKQKFIASHSDISASDWTGIDTEETERFKSLKKELQDD